MPQHVALQTSHGDIILALDDAKAPITVQNFLEYVDAGHYDGTIFHRVIDGFMIQGGGFTPEMQQKTTRANIKNEWKNGLKNKRGAIAMARLGGNPDSASSQFFINLKDNGFLDQAQSDGAAYAAFGEVVKGMDVVDKIKVVKTKNQGGHGDVPVTPVLVTKARRATAEETK